MSMNDTRTWNREFTAARADFAAKNHTTPTKSLKSLKSHMVVINGGPANANNFPASVTGIIVAIVDILSERGAL